MALVASAGGPPTPLVKPVFARDWMRCNSVMASMDGMVKVFVIILNWNGYKDTLECLRSVDKIDYPKFETVVVDNASTDGSVEAIRKRFPHVTLLENGQNLGYAAGNNVGIRHALANGAGYILLLNNDTVVDP
jgi:GT2 family glycosyltransferase